MPRTRPSEGTNAQHQGYHTTSKACVTCLTKEGLVTRFSDVFDGKLGHLEGEVSLELDENVAPIKLPVRHFPVAVREELKDELD